MFVESFIAIRFRTAVDVKRNDDDDDDDASRLFRGSHVPGIEFSVPSCNFLLDVVGCCLFFFAWLVARISDELGLSELSSCYLLEQRRALNKMHNLSPKQSWFPSIQTYDKKKREEPIPTHWN